jgi:hypothetical protein
MPSEFADEQKCVPTMYFSSGLDISQVKCDRQTDMKGQKDVLFLTIERGVHVKTLNAIKIQLEYII